MGSSLFAGISGLNASSQQMDVIGNNIANVNTVGYKSAKISFGDILSQSIAGGVSSFMQIGRGVSVNSVGTQFLPGSFETTGSATDLAIDGSGFFMVNDSDGGSYYTRAGTFHLDSNGNLVDVNDYKVQGHSFFGTDPNMVTDISLKNVQSSPKATSTVSIGVNLDAQTTTGDTFNTAQTVYDSLGAEHTLKTTFQKTEEAGVWAAQGDLDNVDSTSQNYYGVKFDSNGVLDKVYMGTVGTVTPTGTGVATATVDNPGQVSHTGTFLLTAGATAADWTITDPGGYTNATIISADASTVKISLDGTSSTVADVTLTLTTAFSDTNTAQFTLTGCEAGPGLVTSSVAAASASADLNNPEKFVAADTFTLTRGATADSWSVTTAAGYTSAAVLTSSDTEITMSLDGGTDADITLTLSGIPAAGTLIFDLVAGNAINPVDITLTLPSISSGATIGSSGVITWDIAGDSADMMTGYASTSAVQSLTSDGYSSGILQDLSVTQDGTLSGFFTNGQTQDIGQIVLAEFSNPGGLNRMGDNLFGATNESGAAIQNVPGSAGMGEINSNSLEMSNVDIAAEFINMITAQRAYQASSKVITTTDAMMSELMNIKR